MRLLNSGLIQEFLNLLGIEIVTSSGAMVAFIICGAILSVSICACLLLFFKFLVYLRKG